MVPKVFALGFAKFGKPELLLVLLLLCIGFIELGLLWELLVSSLEGVRGVVC